jgi:exoribonuclease-2
MRNLMRAVLDDGLVPSTEEAAPLVAELTGYLENPFSRSRELSAMLEMAMSDITPAEAAYEMLVRLGAAPPGPRFAVIGGIRTNFSDAAVAEAHAVAAPDRPSGDDTGAVAIDDEETVEVDDALSCEQLPDGRIRVRIHIALVADFVPKGGAMDVEAAARGATVYLPETTIRMLPDLISTDAASLSAGKERHVLTTEVYLSPQAELTNYSIYPDKVRIASRMNYERADELLSADPNGQGASLRCLHETAIKLRERRRSAGAVLMQRREPKIRVIGDEIEVKTIDNASPSRQLVAEFMVLSNYVAARFAADHQVPMIYRVQPGTGGDFSTQKPRLSLYPEFHAGVALDHYVQMSSPIRRYMDLVLQRQLIAALSEHGTPAYRPEDLLSVLASAESTESDGRELERRAKRYWLLRYLERQALAQPLQATVIRDGATAELDDYAIRGTLRGALNVASRTRIVVQIRRIDSIRGWLTLDYVGPTKGVTERPS